jgi:hypothetical protein
MGDGAPDMSVNGERRPEIDEQGRWPVSRRTLLKAGWSVPVILTVAPSVAFAASGTPPTSGTSGTSGTSSTSPTSTQGQSPSTQGQSPSTRGQNPSNQGQSPSSSGPSPSSGGPGGVPAEQSQGPQPARVNRGFTG